MESVLIKGRSDESVLEEIRGPPIRASVLAHDSWTCVTTQYLTLHFIY